MYYNFNSRNAILFGVDEAIFLEKLIQLIFEKKAIKNTEEYGKQTWIKISGKQFTKIFPFWTTSQTKRIINSLKKQKIIQTHLFNPSMENHTKSYALKNEEDFISIISKEENNYVLYA